MTKEAAMRVDGVGKKTDLSSAKSGEARTSKLSRVMPRESFEAPPLIHAVLTYISYAILFIFGQVADLLRRLGIKKDLYTVKDVSVCTWSGAA